MSSTVARLESWTLDELKSERERLGEEGRPVVFTNGVFDLIHPGHVRYLREARALGGALVVAVNSDESVRRLKGEKRPVLPQNERVKILASLESVDYVIVFEEDTPLETIEALRPDVLVKGADYTLDQVAGRREVESWGGHVRTIQLTPGASSSEIVGRIVEAQRRT